MPCAINTILINVGNISITQFWELLVNLMCQLVLDVFKES